MKIKKIEKVHYDKPIPVYDVMNVKDTHNFCIVGNRGFIISHNCDEMNFSQANVKDVNKAKAHMLDLYNTISARVKGTFRVNGEVFGKIFAISSKRSDSDFMENYIQQQIEAGASEHMYISDAPQWEVLPPEKFSKDKFYIAVGDRHLRGFVVPDNQTDEASLEELRKKGYTLLTPPLDMRSNFVADFDISLRDLAGISVPGSLSFITQDSLTECIDTTRHNPFLSDILEIGTKDNLSISEFFHQEVIDPRLKSLPLYIHLDLSLTTDKTGISGVVISGRKDTQDESGKVVSQLMFSHIFSISLQAPRGDKIPYSKITEFIVWLRRNGFHIERISRDQFQSEYMAQLLEAQGFTVDKISLDRTPDGYIALRSILLDKRVSMLNCQLLQDELIHLQRDSISGKVDHPVGGCFTIDTKIRTTECDITIGDLLENNKYRYFEVYTVNEEILKVETHRILNVFETKKVTELLELTFTNTNGSTVRCTPEHRFMLKDGTYKEAEYLDKEDILMSAMCDIKLMAMKRIILQEPISVYDLTIEGNPNFLLSAGVFVHNSKDMADSFAGSIWNAMLNNPTIPVPSKSVIGAIASINGSRGGRPDANSLFGFGNIKRF